MLPKRTKITGVSASCCLGSNIDEIITKLYRKERGQTFNHRFKKWTKSPLGEMNFESFGLDKPSESACDKSVNHIISHWIEDLQEQTRLFDRYQPSEIGLIIGSTTYGIEETFKSYNTSKDNPSIFNFASKMMQTGKLIEEIASRFPIEGFSTAVSTACSSGAIAIGEAYLAVKSGMLKACIAGGFDLLNTVTICGFDSLQVLDNDLCNPFHKNRNGINLAEGGAVIVIEADENGHEPIGHIVGYGVSSEGYHPTHPEPNGKGMEFTMKMALDNSSYKSSDVRFINAHGTGTIPNDKAERLSIDNMFENIPYYTTKQYTGHCLAGAGALEAVLTLKALDDQNLHTEILKEKKMSINSDKPVALSNSFGFGGSNASLLLTSSKGFNE
ncbi:MAG: beta-ketoacyl-[acyl-carrier-protein] synthase family protein [Desulfobacterales bacterium]|nr:beta-ketoacyl-[acyl-carrier-protein] synthase family protein [Desulfobacterales bacterium]MCP4160421.1 beta-ketoacyl-[acyl-carrier-protein] synthase family protein [Deltaproteobacteria bacterium]